MPSRIIVCAFDRNLVRRSPFTCGRPELDRWLRERADAPGTLLALDADADQVAGYVAAGRYQLALTDGPAGAPPALVGATLVRFAVAADYRRRGVGRLLLLDALRRLDRVEQARLVVVHALDEASAGYYGRYGFRRLPDHRLTLYLTDRRLRGAVTRLGRTAARPADRGEAGPKGRP